MLRLYIYIYFNLFPCSTGPNDTSLADSPSHSTASLPAPVPPFHSPRPATPHAPPAASGFESQATPYPRPAAPLGGTTAADQVVIDTVKRGVEGQRGR